MKTEEPAQRYPLHWPAGWKRTPSSSREQATFGKTVANVSRIERRQSWKHIA